MKSKKTVRAFAGGALCAIGILLTLSAPRDQRHTFRMEAGGCRLVTDIVEPTSDSAPQGYVVLLHGLAANKRIMSYWTEGFASQGLRVFVPDMPGHGRTEGRFSFERADECSENLLRELIGRGLLDPERTILAGHSMGGAIALRVASRDAVAGVVAISPAPLRPIPGLPAEVMPFHDFGKMPAHALVMNGSWEPGSTSKAAADLVPSANDASDRYVLIPRASHVSILFDSTAMVEAQNWAANVLHIEKRPLLPSHKSMIGFLLGLAGIVTLVGPFLREILDNKKQPTPPTEAGPGLPKGRLFLEFGLIALGTVGFLRFVIPLRALRLFEGDYFASLLLIAGVVLLGLNWTRTRQVFGPPGDASHSSRARYVPIVVAAFAALLLYVLFCAWLDLSVMEAWPTTGRMVRFVPLLVAVLLYQLAEELLLGPVKGRKRPGRLATAILLRVVVWLAIVAGIFVLRSGEIIPVVLLPAFALFSVGQRWSMDVVREVTASPSASALFGAILLAGFCLVVFPTT